MNSLFNFKIIFDDHDTKNFNLNWWRSQLSIVSQEAVLFNMSFRDNIRLGNINATDQEIEEAAKAGFYPKNFFLKGILIFKNLFYIKLIYTMIYY